MVCEGEQHGVLYYDECEVQNNLVSHPKASVVHTPYIALSAFIVHYTTTFSKQLGGVFWSVAISIACCAEIS